jgi:hypothetical protein
MARRARNTAQQGASFERQIMHDLQRYGYLTMRSAASKGAIDVMAVGARQTLVIQAKVSDPVIPPHERRAVLELADRMGPTAVPLVATKRSVWTDYRLLTGPGPKEWLTWEPEPTPYALCAGCGHTAADHGSPVRKKSGGCWGPEDAGCPMRCPRFILHNVVGLDTPVPELS